MGLADSLDTAFQKAKIRIISGKDPFWHTHFAATGVPPVDRALGGGFAFGRIAEVFGDYSTGKTLILYMALIANQKRGGLSALAESEGAFDPAWYEGLGGDPDKLILYPVDTCEEAFNFFTLIADNKIKSGDTQHVVAGWDGIAATGTKHLQEVGMEVKDMSKAEIMSRGCQLITTKIKESNICLIATNQVREKIGSMDTSPHTPGGKGWGFHSSQRVYVRFDGSTKNSIIADPDTQQEIGRWIRGQVIKSKVAPPFKKFNLSIYTEKGATHPEYGWAVNPGIDVYESLFYMYTEGNFFLPDKTKAIKVGAWNKLHPSIDPEQTSFRKGDWPSIVGKFPILWRMAYGELPDAFKDTPTAATTEESNAGGDGEVSEADNTQ